jgi:hypothetical protein
LPCGWSYSAALVSFDATRVPSSLPLARNDVVIQRFEGPGAGFNVELLSNKPGRGS